MDPNAPGKPNAQEPSPESGSRVFVWVAILIAVFVATVGSILFVVEHHAREAAQTGAAPPNSFTEASPLILFEPEDVTVNLRWTLLAGRHPTVTFTCRISPTLNKPKAVFLYYRPVGATNWETVETHPNRTRTCKTTLRDLHRNTTYECFFILCGKELIIKSSVVVFSTQ